MRVYLDLFPERPDASPSKGSIPADVAIVGIAPARARPAERRNEPFGSRSFFLLNNLIGLLRQSPHLRAHCGIEGDRPMRFYVTNFSKEPADKPKFTKKQIREWYPALMEELRLANPRRILALGLAPAQVLCPGFSSMREDHGTIFYNPELEAVVVPTFHFSAVARNPANKKMFQRDVQRFAELGRPGQPNYSIAGIGYWDPEGMNILPSSGYERMPREVILDIETAGEGPRDGLDPRKGWITMIGYKTDVDPVVTIIENPTVAQMRGLHEAIRFTGATVVGHNLQFDLGFLEEKSGLHWGFPTRDTMLLAYTTGEESLSLKNLTAVYTDRPGSRALGSIADHGYLAEDVLSTEAIQSTFLSREAGTSYAAGLLNRLIPTTVGMQRRGVYIDYERMLPLMEHQRETSHRVAGELTRELGIEFKLEKQPKRQDEVIKWTAPKQVAEALQYIGLELTEKTKTGQNAVNEAALLDLAKRYPDQPILKLLLEYRAAVKELAFYENYNERTSHEHPYLHPKLRLTGARTGRLSCADPNLQNVPRLGPIKTLFLPRWRQPLMVTIDGQPAIAAAQYGLIDLSQAELRVICMLANDLAFAEDLKSGDVHRINAAQCYHLDPEQVTSGQRKKVKGVTFGLIYGGSAAGLARRVGVHVNEVNEILRSMKKRYPGLMRWLEETGRIGNHELEIFTHFGRRRDLSTEFALNGENGVYRKAVNTPVQGLASDIALCLLDYVANTLISRNLRSRPLFPVHDSILGEIYPGEELSYATVVQEAFVNLGNTPLATLPLYSDLPFEGDLIVGDSWAAVESTNEHYAKDRNREYHCSSLADGFGYVLRGNSVPLALG